MFNWTEHKARTRFVGPEGTGRNGVLLLGEAPGAREDQLGRPFVGDAGLQLENTLSVVRELDRKHEWAAERGDFAIDNVVHYRPPNNWLENSPWEREAVEGDQGLLRETILRYRPKVVVPTGNVALNAVIGRKGIDACRGYVFDCSLFGHECFVVPTYHPSYLLRGARNLTAVHAWDITRALRVARDGYEEPNQEYLLDPPPWQARAWANRALALLKPDGDLYLTVDMEKWPPPGYELITRVGFAYEPGRAMTVPFRPEYFDVIRMLYETKRTPYMVFWNADFDVPEMRGAGFRLRVPVLDAMWQWHFVQSDIPKWDDKKEKLKSEGKKLAFVAPFHTQLREFKHLSIQEAIRPATDCDAQITCCYGMRAQLRAEGRWEQFIRHWVQTQPILDKIGASGLRIDLKKREELSQRFTLELARVEAKIAEAVPPSLRPVIVRKKVTHDGRGGVPPHANVGDPVIHGGKQGVYAVNEHGEWCIAFPFNVGSSKQVIKYAKFRGHRIPLNYKTERETTDKNAVEALAKRYPRDLLYGLIVESRQWRKLKDQYIDGIVPGPDGRVRTRLGRTPSTWRFSSKGPNLQNLPARADIARVYREMFIAS